jgi:hypothetical protein
LVSQVRETFEAVTKGTGLKVGTFSTSDVVMLNLRQVFLFVLTPDRNCNWSSFFRSRAVANCR